MANAFDDSIAAAARVGPKIGSRLGAKRVDESGGQRRLGADKRPVDPLLPGERNQGGDVCRSDVDARRDLADARIAGRGENATRRIFLAQAPGERVFAPASAHEKDGQRFRHAELTASLRAAEPILELIDRLAGLLAVVASGVGVVLTQRVVLVAAAAPDVVAGHDLVEAARALPAKQLGRANRVHRVRAHDGVEDLQNGVPRVAAGLVLLRLANELVDAQLVAVRLAAGELHFRAHHRVQVLHGEQAGAVRRELALAAPLEQRELEGQQRRRGEEGKIAHPEVHENDGDRRVRRVAAHDVTELVAENRAKLVLVEDLEQPGVNHDERLVEADGHRVRDRCLAHVELGSLGPVEGLEHLGPHRVQLRTLSGGHLHGVAEEQLANPTLAKEAGDLSHYLVEAGNGAKRIERGAIGGVFPGAGRDLDELDAVCHGEVWMRVAVSGGKCLGPYGAPLPIVSRALEPLDSRPARSGIPSKACSRSASRSPTSSTPQESRTRPSLSPRAARRSGGTDACVIPAGWLISDSTPPSDSASANTRTRPRTCAARSFVPSSTLIIPPKPDICRLANSCCGCEGSPM